MPSSEDVSVPQRQAAGDLPSLQAEYVKGQQETALPIRAWVSYTLTASLFWMCCTVRSCRMLFSCSQAYLYSACWQVQ